jgi:hypothetical protein
VDALESRLDRSSQLELTRSEGRLYVTAAGDTLETSLERTSLVDP